MELTTAPLHDRLTAALRALAVGDALGRATEHYQPDEIIEVYEDVIRELVEPIRLADDETWEQGEIGPPTTRVLAALAAIDTTDSAGRIEQIAGCFGHALTPDRAGDDLTLARRVIAAAFAVAFAGYAARDALGAAVREAAAGDAALAADIAHAGGLAQGSGGRRPGAALRAAFPPDGDVRALLPFTLALVYATQSARRALLDAVNEGGHAPETAGLAGALCAALIPHSLPLAWAAEVEQVNDLDLAALAAAALAGLPTSHPEIEDVNDAE